MQIQKATYAGFCFGVRRAVDMVNDLIKNGGGKVYTLGHLIHNPVFNKALEEKGVVNCEDLAELFERAETGERVTAVIRTHGTTKEVSEKLFDFAKKHDNFKVIDCTCPKVKKIHEIVDKESSPDNLTVIFGSKEHPEVLGIKSYSHGESVVVEDRNQLENMLPFDKNILMVSQTTQKLTEWKYCTEIVEKVYTSAKIFGTICGVTEKRQKEVSALASNVDVMMIIGGHESSNTNKLYQIAKAICKETYFIETTADIPSAYIGRNLKIGIAAGASTPDDIIGEVISKMSEELKNDEITEKELSELLAGSGMKIIRTGDTVSGVISSIGSTEVTVDLNTNVTGMLPTEELGTPEEIAEKYHVGDTIDAVVTKVSDKEGVATLSRKKIMNLVNWSSIKEAYESGAVLEGKVTEAVKGGIIINIKGSKIFVPASQSGIARGGDLNALVGTTQQVKIIDLNEDRHRAVASVREAKRAEREAVSEKFWSEAEVGKEYDGTVRSITSYGAFVDLGGVDGMVHVSELSWKHIKNPSEVVKVGDTIHVFIKELDPERKRISLGYRLDADNPWNKFIEEYKIDDEIDVTVQSLTAFGAFAEIIPGIDGLIHISQIANKIINKPSEVLKKGDVIRVKITEINEDNHRISLSRRAVLAEEEAAEEEQIKEEAGDLLITPDDEPADEPAEEAPVEAAEAPAEEAPEAPAEETPAEPAE